jgi:hypothetical protein
MTSSCRHFGTVYRREFIIIIIILSVMALMGLCSCNFLCLFICVHALYSGGRSYLVLREKYSIFFFTKPVTSADVHSDWLLNIAAQRQR